MGYCVEVNRTYICLDLLQAQTKYLLDFYEKAEKHVTIEHKESYAKKRKILNEKKKVLLDLKHHFKQRNEIFFNYFIFPTFCIFLVMGFIILYLINCNTGPPSEEDELEEEIDEGDEGDEDLLSESESNSESEPESEPESEDAYSIMRTSG